MIADGFHFNSSANAAVIAGGVHRRDIKLKARKFAKPEHVLRNSI
jgi:hypothetical protein